MTNVGEIWTKLPGANVATTGVIVNDTMLGGVDETVTEAMPCLPGSAVEVATIVVVPAVTPFTNTTRVNTRNRRVARTPKLPRSRHRRRR